MKAKKENNNSIFSILKGEFIADHNNQKYAPFLLMLVVFMLVNISVSFRVEGLLRESIALEEEVADLRLVYITTRSGLMSMCRRSVVEGLVINAGLKTSLTPPVIIDLANEE